MTHGGKRKGAGRPPRPASEVRSVRVTLYLTPGEADALGRWAAWNCSTIGPIVRAYAMSHAIQQGFREPALATPPPPATPTT